MTSRRLLIPLRLIVLLMALAVPLADRAPAAATAPTAKVSEAGTVATTTTTTLPEDNGNRSVIPLPNSGKEPEASGDRGGWAQLLLFGLLLAGSGFIFGRVLWAARQRGPHDRQR